MSTGLRCGLCGDPMAYIHGHGACVRSGCPLYGQNQAECCDGESACNVPAHTSELRAGPRFPIPRDD